MINSLMPKVLSDVSPIQNVMSLVSASHSHSHSCGEYSNSDSDSDSSAERDQIFAG